MPKTIRNVFYKKLTFENLLKAHNRTRVNKAKHPDIIEFETNLENNIVNILNSLKNNTYKIGDYKSFIIREPKEREIQALPYKDRVVQQWYVEEFIKPYFLPRFIKDTYACIPNRGTHSAVNAIQKYMRIKNLKNKKYWILKCDVKKFFYSIQPDILFNILKKYISDKHLLDFTKKLIYDKRDSFPNGIPIRELQFTIFCQYISW